MGTSHRPHSTWHSTLTARQLRRWPLLSTSGSDRDPKGCREGKEMGCHIKVTRIVTWTPAEPPNPFPTSRFEVARSGIDPGCCRGRAGRAGPGRRALAALPPGVQGGILLDAI